MINLKRSAKDPIHFFETTSTDKGWDEDFQALASIECSGPGKGSANIRTLHGGSTVAGCGRKSLIGKHTGKKDVMKTPEEAQARKIPMPKKGTPRKRCLRDFEISTISGKQSIKNIYCTVHK